MLTIYNYLRFIQVIKVFPILHHHAFSLNRMFDRIDLSIQKSYFDRKFTCYYVANEHSRNHESGDGEN